MTEQGRHRLFEAAAEQHSGANVVLSPAIQIVMAVAAGRSDIGSWKRCDRVR